MKYWQLEVEKACVLRWTDGYRARGGKGHPPWPPTNLDNRPWLEELFEELLDALNYFRADVSHCGSDRYEWPNDLVEFERNLLGLLVWTQTRLKQQHNSQE